MMYLHMCSVCKKMWRDITPTSKCPICGKTSAKEN